MSIIGNPLTSMAFVTDFFSGTGSTTAFTMSVAPANTASALVVISGVVQDPSAYAVAGTILTFSAAPPAGSNNISVRYLGLPANGVTTTAYRTVTEFTATASQTVFAIPSYTLGYINVYRNGVRLGTADYTATNGTTVVLANAATLGDLVTTESFYVSSVLNAIPAIAGQVGATYLAAGAASQAFLDSASGNGTGAMRLPVGSTAQRPTGSSGLIRQNSTTGNPEWWDGTTNNWQQFSQPAGYSVNYLIVAGGGGGAGTGVSTAGGGGGGGAGGLLTSSMTLSSGTSYTVTVGGGGAGGAGANSDSTGTAGTSSSFNLISTNGGGGGGDADKGHPGAAGGSGGGGGGGGGSAAGRVAGAGTNGQGYAGGAGYGVAQNYSGGGGGGAATLGVAGAAAIGGNGGAGSASSISGTATYYAGGGGGGINSNATNSGAIPGVGGLGGGGAGGKTAPGTAATANTGGGGGGGGGDTLNNGASGGSGVVIISYLGSQRGTGGGISSSGGYTIHTFTSSGTYNA
jgi:hypothetical protein